MTAVLAGLSCWLWLRAPVGDIKAEALPKRRPSLKVGRGLVALGAGLGAWFVIGGPSGGVVATVAVALSWFVLSRAEPATVRRERALAARELPHLVDLFAATLRSGAAPMAGLRMACDALPGAAATRLGPVLAHAELGGVEPWQQLAVDEVLAPLGEALARAHRSGASIVDVVERLSVDLEHDLAADIEDRARRVGVSAALPLGVCLLPAFMLLGIVPTVAALLASITK